MKIINLKKSRNKIPRGLVDGLPKKERSRKLDCAWWGIPFLKDSEIATRHKQEYQDILEAGGLFNYLQKQRENT